MLVACGSPSVSTVPDDTSAPTPPTPPVCIVEDDAGTSIDCADVDPCDPDALGIRIDCCDCDEAYCTADCGWDQMPEPFPPDSGAELVFEAGLQQELRPLTFDVWIGPDPDGLLLVPREQIADATPAVCARTGNTFRCETPLEAGTTIYEMLEVRVADQDGDGMVDSGQIRAFGRSAPPSTGGPYGVDVVLEPDSILRFDVDNADWSGWADPEFDWLWTVPPAEPRANIAFDHIRFEEAP